MKGRTFEQSEPVRTECTFLKGSKLVCGAAQLTPRLFLLQELLVLEFPASVFLFLVFSLDPRLYMGSAGLL